MLSEDALRLMGNLDRAQIEERVRQIYDRWAHGDIDAIVAGMTPDVKFATNRHWEGSPPSSQGRPAAAATLRSVGAALENIVSVLHEIIIDGDRAVVHRTAVGRWRGSGRRYQCEFIDFLRFRDALLAEFTPHPGSDWREALAES